MRRRRGGGGGAAGRRRPPPAPPANVAVLWRRALTATCSLRRPLPPSPLASPARRPSPSSAPPSPPSQAAKARGGSYFVRSQVLTQHNQHSVLAHVYSPTCVRARLEDGGGLLVLHDERRVLVRPRERPRDERHLGSLHVLDANPLEVLFIRRAHHDLLRALRVRGGARRRAVSVRSRRSRAPTSSSSTEYVGFG